MLKNDTENQKTIEILGSVKGIGPVTISTILAAPPVIGTLNRGEVAKLVGVAAINRDSGNKSGKKARYDLEFTDQDKPTVGEQNERLRNPQTLWNTSLTHRRLGYPS